MNSFKFQQMVNVRSILLICVGIMIIACSQNEGSGETPTAVETLPPEIVPTAAADFIRGVDSENAALLLYMPTKSRQVRDGIGDSDVLALLERKIRFYRFDSQEDADQFRLYVIASAFEETGIRHIRNGEISTNTDNEDGSVDYGVMQINDLSHPDCFTVGGLGLCGDSPECVDAPQPKAFDLDCNVAAGVRSHYIGWFDAKVRREAFSAACTEELSTAEVAMKIYNGGPDSFNITKGCDYAKEVTRNIDSIFE